MSQGRPVAAVCEAAFPGRLVRRSRGCNTPWRQGREEGLVSGWSSATSQPIHVHVKVYKCVCICTCTCTFVIHHLATVSMNPKTAPSTMNIIKVPCTLDGEIVAWPRQPCMRPHAYLTGPCSYYVHVDTFVHVVYS